MSRAGLLAGEARLWGRCAGTRRGEAVGAVRGHEEAQEDACRRRSVKDLAKAWGVARARGGAGGRGTAALQRGRRAHLGRWTPPLQLASARREARSRRRRSTATARRATGTRMRRRTSDGGSPTRVGEGDGRRAQLGGWTPPRRGSGAATQLQTGKASVYH
ncbi:hypothetical protein ZWY2020_033989 [Hordeum vulgare]|nr:hypothetical protein ZWY2020_033989 [Hordeum vulgare]